MRKFSTQVAQEVLEQLREFARLSNKSISKIVNEAIADYLKRAQVRPAFLAAMEEVVEENEELLQRLARRTSCPALVNK